MFIRTKTAYRLELKYCSQCQTWYPRNRDHFFAWKCYGSTDGFFFKCIPCARAANYENYVRKKADRDAYTARYREEHHEQVKQKNRETSATNWAKRLVVACRSSSKARNMTPPDFDEQFVLELFTRQVGKCHWFNIPMLPTADVRDPQKPSIDRLDNARSYERDNVVLVCAAANLGRSNASQERFKAFCDSLLSRGNI